MYHNPKNKAADAAFGVKYLFRYVFDASKAEKAFAEGFVPYLYESELLSGYNFQLRLSELTEQGDALIREMSINDEPVVEVCIIPKFDELVGNTPADQAFHFLAGVLEYADELALRQALVGVELVKLKTPAKPKVRKRSANDDEFVYSVLEDGIIEYVKNFEVEQSFVLEHEDELPLPDEDIRWWKSNAPRTASIADWYEHERQLVEVVRETPLFAYLSK